VREQLGSLSTQITDKSLAVDLQLGDAHYVSANRDSLSLLLSNIIGNAVKFSAPEGRLLIFREQDKLFVEDDGPGVPIAERSKVFERFYRSHSVSNQRGSGLGLSLSRWVAQMHEFTLSCEAPNKGAGASFVLDMGR